jgi:hypothetical protein
MTKHPPVPGVDAAEGVAHGDAREKRQPYAVEHEDYHDGVATPPEEQGGAAPVDKTPIGQTRKARPERRR